MTATTRWRLVAVEGQRVEVDATLTIASSDELLIAAIERSAALCGLELKRFRRDEPGEATRT